MIYNFQFLQSSISTDMFLIHDIQRGLNHEGICILLVSTLQQTQFYVDVLSAEGLMCLGFPTAFDISHYKTSHSVKSIHSVDVLCEMQISMSLMENTPVSQYKFAKVNIF